MFKMLKFKVVSAWSCLENGCLSAKTCSHGILQLPNVPWYQMRQYNSCV